MRLHFLCSRASATSNTIYQDFHQAGEAATTAAGIPEGALAGPDAPLDAVPSHEGNAAQ